MSTYTPAPWKLDRSKLPADPTLLQIKDAAICQLQNERTELLAALKNAVARMEENHPPKAKRGDLNATFKNATFYRDLEAARAAILKAEG